MVARRVSDAEVKVRKMREFIGRSWLSVHVPKDVMSQLYALAEALDPGENMRPQDRMTRIVAVALDELLERCAKEVPAIKELRAEAARKKKAKDTFGVDTRTHRMLKMAQIVESQWAYGRHIEKGIPIPKDRVALRRERERLQEVKKQAQALSEQRYPAIKEISES